MYRDMIPSEKPSPWPPVLAWPGRAAERLGRYVPLPRPWRTHERGSVCDLIHELLLLLLLLLLGDQIGERLPQGTCRSVVDV